jgi:hypothetical protein
MAVAVKNYHVLFYGGPDGYQSSRAQITLYDAADKTVASLRFHDPGMTFENDSDSDGMIHMHLPSAMLENVLNVLQNEKPVAVSFAVGNGFLSTYGEPIGEQE